MEEYVCLLFGSGDPFILVWDENLCEGVNGLTATHITKKYNVPSAVLSPVKGNPDLFKGSARSVEECNLIELLGRSDLINAGGHAMAAGITIERKNLLRAREFLCDELRDIKFKKKDEADFIYDAKDITKETLSDYNKMIDEMEPFGPGYEEPVIEMHAEVKEFKGLKNKDVDKIVHAKFVLKAEEKNDNCIKEAIWWHHYNDAKDWKKKGNELRCQGKLNINTFKNTSKLQFIIDSIK